MLDAHLLRTLVLVRSADAAGIQQEDLERMLVEELEKTVPLQVVQHREEGVRSRHAE
jgi:hypothetical protein